MLETEDFHSKTWKRLTKVLEARLKTLRELNDASSSLEATEKIRGQIFEVKKILALASKASASPMVAPGELIGDDQSAR